MCVYTVALVYVGSILIGFEAIALPKVLMTISTVYRLCLFLPTLETSLRYSKQKCTEGFICITKRVVATSTVYRLCLFLPTLERSLQYK